MGIFDIIGEIAAVPFKVAMAPVKVAKAIDQATLDTGVGECLDDVQEATVGEVGRAVKRGLQELDD